MKHSPYIYMVQYINPLMYTICPCLYILFKCVSLKEILLGPFYNQDTVWTELCSKYNIVMSITECTIGSSNGWVWWMHVYIYLTKFIVNNSDMYRKVTGFNL